MKKIKEPIQEKDHLPLSLHFDQWQKARQNALGLPPSSKSPEIKLINIHNKWRVLIRM